jgi:hypothetical protein
MSGEDQDLAAGANEGVVLAATDTRRIVGNHGRQDQLGATRTATHRLHSDQHSRAELHSCSADIYRGKTNKALRRSVGAGTPVEMEVVALLAGACRVAQLAVKGEPVLEPQITTAYWFEEAVQPQA